MPCAAQGLLLSATRIRPNELEGVNNASGPSRGPGGRLRPCAGVAFHRRGVIRFEIKGGTKYEFKFKMYSASEMMYSGKVSSSLGGRGWGERRREKPSALRGGPGWPCPGHLAPRALGQKRGQFGDLGAAGKEEEGQYNQSLTLALEGPPYTGLPQFQKDRAEFLPKRVLAPICFPVGLQFF